MRTDHEGYCLDKHGDRMGRRVVGGAVLQHVGERMQRGIEAKFFVQKAHPAANARKIRLAHGAAEHVIYDRAKPHTRTPDQRVILGRGRLAPDAWKDAYANLPDSAKMRPSTGVNRDRTAEIAA
jgi:hypothetical protein